MKKLQFYILVFQKYFGPRFFIICYEIYIFVISKIIFIVFSPESIYRIRGTSKKNYTPGLSDIDLLIISKNEESSKSIISFLRFLHKVIPLIEYHPCLITTYENLVRNFNLYAFWKYRYLQMKHEGSLIYGPDKLQNLEDPNQNDLREIAWNEISEWIFYIHKQLLYQKYEYKWQYNLFYYKILVEIYRLYLGFSRNLFFIDQKQTIELSYECKEFDSKIIERLINIKENFFLTNISRDDQIQFEDEFFKILNLIVNMLYAGSVNQIEISIKPNTKNNKHKKELHNFKWALTQEGISLDFQLIQCCEFYFSEFLLIITVPDDKSLFDFDWKKIRELKSIYCSKEFKLCIKTKFNSGLIYLEQLTSAMNYHSFFHHALFPDLKFFLEENIDFSELKAPKHFQGTCSTLFVNSKKNIIFDIETFIYSKETYKYNFYNFIQGFWKVIYAIYIAEQLNQSKKVLLIYSPEELIELDPMYKTQYSFYLTLYHKTTIDSSPLVDNQFYTVALKFLDQRYKASFLH